MGRLFLLFSVFGIISSCATSAELAESTDAEITPQIVVLDSDTLVIDGAVVRLHGIDAPEMPPHSKCWAEAALAGHAKKRVEELILADALYPPALDYGGWHITETMGTDSYGHLLVRLSSRGGADLADILVVNGYAARAPEWDWCGPNADFRNNTGPNLWYPPDEKLDGRVAD